MTSGRGIDYEALTHEAMRGMVRRILADVARNGLPGRHHFYIAFNTRAPGVQLSRRLREKYPFEMTIVLQHRFWDLAVTEDRFEVKLTFEAIAERLVIPFSAIKVFYDPSVPYGHQFEDVDANTERSQRYFETEQRAEAVEPDTEAGRAHEIPPTVPLPTQPQRHKNPEAPERRRMGETQSDEPDRETAEHESDKKPMRPVPVEPTEEAAEVAEEAKVVSLDAFRKKS